MTPSLEPPAPALPPCVSAVELEQAEKEQKERRTATAALDLGICTRTKSPLRAKQRPEGAPPLGAHRKEFEKSAYREVVSG
jgi:hypothetical protein